MSPEAHRHAIEPLSPEAARVLASEVPRWTIEGQSLTREFTFADFRAAMAFVNRIAETAEEQNHHPDINVSYNRVKLTLTTHKIGGLSRADFLLAEKIDQLAA